MREIKFRAFDEGEITFCPIGTNYGLHRFFGILNDEALIMQYTGLKDKNNVDIYEGDIILYQDCKGEVYYCSDTCMFMSKFKTTHSSWSFDSMDDEIIVIGNIHENPELLCTSQSI